MNAEIKAKWVEALRSGKYAQGRGRLRRKTKNGEAFCCLGVLAEVVGLARSSTGYVDGAFVYCGSLPYSLIAEGNQNILTGMNDSQQKSFPQIAAWIEENL